ncbi:RDD family protein [Chryseolinea soli]|uniref:RDD family protein n=1 Tax=Chryseolinea soli TaxID=2321403 RepID=A0A385SEF2_9BACT|nr:RDD family protein [Chryseolinea soli]AYB29324.1 RDD family protein [Chryseolinea soli]
MSTIEQTPLSPKEIYGGFWIRLGSFALDFLVIIPVASLSLYFLSVSKILYYAFVLPNLAFVLFFHVYCVKQWGGSPGKLALGLKIVKENGEDVGWDEAVTRHVVMLALTLITAVVTIISIYQVPNDVYYASNLMKRSQAISGVYPKFSFFLSVCTNIWMYSEFLVLLTNRKRKAIHDYMAGTVVIRAKYQRLVKDSAKVETVGV